MERDYPKYIGHYGAARSGFFLQASAEFLPVRDLFVDTVHMRSCLDHFIAPHIALAEAYRVLKPEGRVVVGMSLEGAYCLEPVGVEQRPAMSGPSGLYRSAVTALKQHPKLYSLVNDLRTRFKGEHDHHVFHPTYESLTALVTSAGFTIEQEVSQEAYHNVLYLAARKQMVSDGSTPAT